MSARPAAVVGFAELVRAMEGSGAVFNALSDFAQALTKAPGKNAAHALVHGGRSYPRRALSVAEDEARLGVRAMYAFTIRALSAPEGSDDFAAIGRLRALGHEVLVEATNAELSTVDGWNEIERVGENVIGAGAALRGAFVRAEGSATLPTLEEIVPADAACIVERLRERHRFVGIVRPPEIAAESAIGRPRFLVTDEAGRYVADCLAPEFPILTRDDELEDDVVLHCLIDTVTRDSCLWVVR